MTKGSQLPRLLYVGDVPVEASYHGSALLYRLLQDYPAEKLRVLESSLIRSLPNRRLHRVAYAQVDFGYARLLRTRFSRCYFSWLTWWSSHQSRRIGVALDGFRPEAILTVTHGFLWDSASQFAENHRLPLHLVCHDDWPRCTNVLAFLRSSVDRRLGEVYRQAVSRLCISPFMRDAYHGHYGAAGEVLYPSRAADCPEHASPPERLRQPIRRFTVAFAGTVNTHGCVVALRQIAEALVPLSGRLLIFGPLSRTDADHEALNRPNIECRGLLSSAALLERFRNEVDVLFVPMSFHPQDRSNMELSFPSKLADYTSVGLPLLIYGPEYCSAVRWAGENSGVAELVTQPEIQQLRAAVQRIAQSGEFRWKLGQLALAASEKSFSHGSAKAIFDSAMRRKLPRKSPGPYVSGCGECAESAMEA